MNYIYSPIKYISNGVKPGDKAVIHLLKEDKLFVNLTFAETNESFEPHLTFDKNSIIKELEIKSLLEDVCELILTSSNKVLPFYNYLFVIQNKQKYLLSVSFNNMALSYTLIKEMASILNVKFVNPIWRGILTDNVLNCFVENIFVQKQ